MQLEINSDTEWDATKRKISNFLINNKVSSVLGELNKGEEFSEIVYNYTWKILEKTNFDCIDYIVDFIKCLIKWMKNPTDESLIKEVTIADQDVIYYSNYQGE